MKKLNEMLAVILLSLAAVLVAAVGLRVYDTHVINRQVKQEQEEILSRNREANDRVLEMRREIEKLSEDRDSLAQFFEEIQAAQEQEAIPASNMYDEQESGMTGGLSASELTSMSENAADVSGNMTNLSGNTTDLSKYMTEMSGNHLSLSGNHNRYSLLGNSNEYGLSENGLSLSGNRLSVSGNDTLSENALSISENDSLSGNAIITLEERRKSRTSYEETILVSEEDAAFLAERQVDFSGKKIACLGDSITAAANLEGKENYPACSYPSVLREILGAEEVYNLGIGGSSIGRYWSDPFVERYLEIPADTDIIIVMGGTNDGFCLSEKELGTLTERKPWTFCGDLDELMRGLKENYPEAEIYFVTPLPNILQDYLMRERLYLRPQRDLVNVVLRLAAEYDFHVIDLYNSNMLDSHDADIVADYVPDGVHANEAGYRILAQHIAAEILRQEEGYEEALQ